MYASWEFVLWALLLAAVVLWNTLQGVLRRRRRARQQAEARAQPAAAAELPASVAVPQPEPEAWGRRPLEDVEAWGRRPMEEVPRAAREPAAEALPVPRRSPPRPTPARDRHRHAHWRSRAAVRRAVIALTVLGPPRATAPWEPADLAASGPRQGGSFARNQEETRP